VSKIRNDDGDDDVLDQHARVDFMVLCLWTTVRMWDVGQSDTLSWHTVLQFTRIKTE
jgi:hypothetical protein